MSDSTEYPKIVLTGVTGKLGGLILAELLKTVPASSIGISARDTSKLADLASQGIRVRQGSYTDEDLYALTHSFEGADNVLIASSNDRSGAARNHHSNAISAAKRAGVRRIFYTSHQAAAPSSAFAPMADHHATEAMLEASGLEYVSLRNGFYMDTIQLFLPGAQTTGVVRAPADGKISWTAHADLAEATARLLLSTEQLDKVITLASDEALDLKDIAEVYSQVQGMDVTRDVQGADAYLEDKVKQGVPPALAGMLVGMFEAAAAGEFQSKDDTLSRLLGRKPIRVRALLQDK